MHSIDAGSLQEIEGFAGIVEVFRNGFPEVFGAIVCGMKMIEFK